MPAIIDRDTNVRGVWLSDATGNQQSLAAGTTSDPAYQRSLGSATFATSQAATSISPATSLLLVAARANRQSVTLTNITGTQPVYITLTAVTTGATTGFYLGAAAGASVTISTAAAIYGTSPTAAQTVGVLETY